MTHTAKFIAEMKQRLEAERDELKNRLTANRSTINPHSATYPDYGRSDEENATETADFVAQQATTDAEGNRLGEVEAALQRITDGTYGVDQSGQPIPEARLRANPAATTNI